MKLNQLLEGSDAFDDVDVIKIDPDRDGAYDIVEKLMPTLARVAYTYLLDDRNKHVKKHGPHDDSEDAYNFAFTKEELRDRLEELIKGLCEKLDDQTSTEKLDAVIDAVSKDFKEKLDEDK